MTLSSCKGMMINANTVTLCMARFLSLEILQDGPLRVTSRIGRKSFLCGKIRNQAYTWYVNVFARNGSREERGDLGLTR
jgi:hypothetical protein